MSYKKIALLVSFCLLVSIGSTVFAQEKVKESPILGDWKGALSVQGTELPLVFHFMMNDKKEMISTLDSPAQNGFDIPMGKVSLVEKKYKIDATDLGASYEGQLKNDSTLTGIWSQGGMSFDLVMKKVVKKKK